MGQHRNCWVKFWIRETDPEDPLVLLTITFLTLASGVTLRFSPSTERAGLLSSSFQRQGLVHSSNWRDGSEPSNWPPVTERPLNMERRQLWRETSVGKVQLYNLSAQPPPEPQMSTVTFPLLQGTGTGKWLSETLICPFHMVCSMLDSLNSL